MARKGGTRRPAAWRMDPPVSDALWARVDKPRLEPQITTLAMENAAGRLGDDAYFARKRQLRDEIAALDRSARPGIDPGRALEWMRALGDTWQTSGVETEKADLLHAIYDRIVAAPSSLPGERLAVGEQL